MAARARSSGVSGWKAERFWELGARIRTLRHPDCRARRRRLLWIVEGNGGEHEGLREEAAAHGRLLADGADAERGEAFGAAELAVLEEENSGGFGAGLIFEGRGLLQDQRAQLVDGANEFVGEQCRGANLLPLLVQRGRAFEIHRLTGGITSRGNFVEQRLPARAEEREDSLRFVRILLGCAGLRVALLARLHALVHLAVDAAGVLGVGLEIFVAAAQQKEVEHGIAGSLGGSARGERAKGFAEGFLA